MPAADDPPIAVIRPPSMLMAPLTAPCVPPPMPAAPFPPCTVRLPSPSMLSVLPSYTAMPGAYAELEKLLSPRTSRFSVTPLSIHIAALFGTLETSRVRLDTVSVMSQRTSMFALPVPVTKCEAPLVMTRDAFCPPPDVSYFAYQPGPDMCAMSSPSISMWRRANAVAAMWASSTGATQMLSSSASGVCAHSYSPLGTQSQAAPLESGVNVSQTGTGIRSRYSVVSAPPTPRPDTLTLHTRSPAGYE